MSSAILSLIGASLHAAVSAQHFREWWGYGVFFILASTAQGLYGLVLFALPRKPNWEPHEWSSWTRRLYLGGILLNCGTLALYIVTRTIGIPFFGPDAGKVESIGVIDLVSKATELALVVLLIVLRRMARMASPEPSSDSA